MSVYPRADGIYVYDFQIKGVRFCRSTGVRSKRAAEEAERKAREAAKQTVAAIRDQRTGPMTINVAFDRFWVEVGEHYKGSYGKLVWASFEWLIDHFGANTLLRDIGPNRISEAIARRRAPRMTPSGEKKPVKNSTVNGAVTEILRMVMRRAKENWEQDLPHIRWGELILPEPRERVRELRDHEEAKLVANMRSDYLPLISFALTSGLRMKELVELKWRAIDWTAKTITVRGKGDKVATIPLTGMMQAILSPLRGHHPEFVFTYVAVSTRSKAGKPHRIKGVRYPVTYEGLKTAWRRFGGAKAGIEDFRFHDQRHTVASRLLRESGNLKLVQKLLRHEELATTAKYAHADHEDLMAAMESVEKSRKNPRTVEPNKGEDTDVA